MSITIQVHAEPANFNYNQIVKESQLTYTYIKLKQYPTYGFFIRFTICGDVCPLSCVNAKACLTGWPNA